ncbi:NUDIX domain-containing protein [Gillisia limnaea]|uniref:NUDIX hydrolase n=1 Tax=Gillisia limnaea (strain DSM 15749 / LMG 21470 / R-8282) TaxID=865937 RepID=H2BQR4_GILLR|nr:NUDIX hydrolase [Gillisia limnaea]EHQ04233.1 NUDIX hydrolase [Gillisia limnaea DSM 15749]
MRDQNIAVTVDSVIFKEVRNGYELLLIRRKNDPFKNQWSLPGGFLEVDEALETGALRELKEETGLSMEKLQQVGAFGALGRDPRGRTISVAFAGKINNPSEVKGGDDAEDAQWFSIDDIPELAFDHAEIIKAAITLL